MERIAYEQLNYAAKRRGTGLTQPNILGSRVNASSLESVVSPHRNPLIRRSLRLTTLQARALLLGERKPYLDYMQYAERIHAAPQVSTLSFRRNITNLLPYNHVSHLSFTLDNSSVSKLVAEMSSRVVRKSGGHLYSSFFINKNARSQIDVYPLLQDMIKKLQSSSLGKDDLIIVPPAQRKRVEIIDSFTTANLLPTSIAATRYQGILNTGAINDLLSTTFGRGDQAVVLAQYREYSLVMNGDIYGWVETAKIASPKDRSIIQGTHKVNYKRGVPYFYMDLDGRNSALLPGDTLYERNGVLFALNRNTQTNNVSLQPLTGLTLADVTQGFTNPQQVLDFLYSLKVPYMIGTFDCSEVIRRAFKLLGKSVGKNTIQITKDLERALCTKEKNIPLRHLTKLPEGIYIATTNERQVKSHVSVLTSTKGYTEIISQQFIQEPYSYKTPHILGNHLIKDIGSFIQTLRGKRMMVIPITGN